MSGGSVDEYAEALIIEYEDYIIKKS